MHLDPRVGFGVAPFFCWSPWLLHHPWTGPYKIVADVTYRIQNCRGRRHRLVVHFNQLKPCPEDEVWGDSGFPLSTKLPSTMENRSTTEFPLIDLEGDDPLTECSST